ncbi:MULTISPECIES: ABC transporter ATP-binding protein [unclassified Solwaraspora]|uniref:ABC transporter ATP-binding protein n=1 Tax=unclassified Solwaraspora TaxID=2627926 RepID=UPI00248D11C5|nr:MULTISPECIES: ABC transporter ATP-binding protein [unclassified Solwaraspora]WBB99682.1 ABC transporter ATP-binding protein [Solwaraspora sp. WMMA2059]WBC21768.1 ABC transporter ATP-binding protein [Solwaraspora sp. WMMA2080]WJK36185.1 ABC transporter ATP-binding protein [Solwaraspora sp. WMMA2065]
MTGRTATSAGRGPDSGPRPAGSPVQVRDVDIRFDDFEAVAGATLDIAGGEFVCLLGPSGCGKSTLLNAIAGFVRPAAGQVLCAGEPVTGPDVSRGVVFQSAEALFPWLTVRQNVAFGPRMRGVPRGQRAGIVDRYLTMVGLSHSGDRFPSQLSGGMRQRAQLARVLANEPSVVLMDEPFGALDAQTRLVMQAELDRIWRQSRPTILFVTHDIGEAILLADRIVTMTAGPAARIKQVYPVDLPRPRELTDPAAAGLFRELREDIGTEVAQTLRAQGLDDGHGLNGGGG